ncbi:MAG: hypothetical protein KatS3mg102_0363 [Planctomycetota bacterium]|nr:MAG: hypothetical protein KatS3mg102_0363 [Planctomycetota bacterium]
MGDWAEVLRELPRRVGDWMERLQAEGIRGADLVFACIGPALEIFSRYRKVETAEGREVTLAEYLEKVWEVVGRTALEQVLGTAEAQARNGAAGALEEDARLTALFLWTLQDHRPAARSRNAGEASRRGRRGARTKRSRSAKARAGATLWSSTSSAASPSRWESTFPDGKAASSRRKRAWSALMAVRERARQTLRRRGRGGGADWIAEDPKKNLQQVLFPEMERNAPPKGRGAGPAAQGAHRRLGGGTEKTARPLRRGGTTLDRVHAAMLLQASGQANALRALLEAEQSAGRTSCGWPTRFPPSTRRAARRSACSTRCSWRCHDEEVSMLKKLTVKGFKSLANLSVDLPRFAVLFGPNAAGKSNLLDAILALSRLGTERTLADALSDPIRGRQIEAFSFPPQGLPALLACSDARFELSADVDDGRDSYRYRLAVRIEPASGRLTVADEYLAQLGAKGEPKGRPQIEQVDGELRIRRKSKPAHPRTEPLGLNHTVLSDSRFGGVEYRALERVRQELTAWRIYYLDPRVAMRAERPPSDVRDIGVLGENIAPFLYRLRAEQPKRFAAVFRTLRSIVPSVEELAVDLDKRRGTLDVLIRQAGVDYSTRIVSEGTLRVLALCAIAVNPWGGSLVGFEEPENGVHPRRLELIAQLLLSLALEQNRQVVVTTHSPLFCDAVLKHARSRPADIGLFNVHRAGGETIVKPFAVTGAVVEDQEIAAALTAGTEDGLFESMLMRGLLDE